MKVAFLQYATQMTKELPLLHQLLTERPKTIGPNEVSPEGHAPHVPRASRAPGVSTWPEGSVWFVRNTRPEVFCQKLVQLPLVLSQMTSLSSQELLQQLQSLVPQLRLGELSGIFWLETASRQDPVQRPGCLLVSGKDVVVLSTEGSSQALSVERFDLGQLREVQIGLAGQHVRLLSCSDGAILAIFTYSKELTQEFCRVLLAALGPGSLPEGREGHPLLSGDLMLLSLDWMSHTPDIVLDGGLRVTCRFKRVLADLLYVVHGNTDGPDKPSLADTRPLLYTSVKVVTSSRLCRNNMLFNNNNMCQLLLTETHLALLREDGVFHPVARGSSLVPARSQFQGLELRRRSQVGCVFVKQSDTWLTVDIVFRPEDQRGSRRSSWGAWRACGGGGLSWRLCLGCTSEAVTLINHLSV